MALLTIGNPKTDKGTKYGYLTGILHLSPSDLSGYNVCPFAKKLSGEGVAGPVKSACSYTCLNLAGRGRIAKGGVITIEELRNGLRTNQVQTARLRRTKALFEDRENFLPQLVKEIRALVRKAKNLNLKPCVRLNGTSDLDWTTIKLDGKTLFDILPEVQFYDYTKVPKHLRKARPANYHLTYSVHDGEGSEEFSDEIDANSAVVFRVKRGADLPKSWRGKPVIDGDDSDLRFLDPEGVIVGLRAKGYAASDETGFVKEAA